MTSLAGLQAVVTGAGQGVGRGIALALAKGGAAVVVAGRTAAKVQRTAREIEDAGGTAFPLPCDVGSRGEIDTMITESVRLLGGLDVLVNNAQSVPPNRRLQDVPITDVELALNAGPIATFHCMQAAFPYLRCSTAAGSYSAEVKGPTT
jgi:2-hydroxycyclohexanecarboxyl-CoA dehydrogenase